MIRAFLLSLAVLALILGCPGDDDDASDDDVGDDDDASDDDVGDDDAGDDDTTSCEIDLEEALITADCTGGPGIGFGTWTFQLELDCPAAAVWVEVWGPDYRWCEYDPYTGDPCDDCPGAGSMANIDFGWDDTQGYWEIWELVVDFDTSVVDPCQFPFPCGQLGQHGEAYMCACDMNAGNCCCTEVVE